jgi:cytochrome b561
MFIRELYTCVKGAIVPMIDNVSSVTLTSKPKRYHPALVTLHWVVAILIFATTLLAMSGEGEGRRGGATIGGFPILGIHMILGITVLILLVVRLLIRWRTQHPEWATTGSAFLDKIGELTHWALYFFTFAITITGLILALQTNRLARVFNITTSQQKQFTPGQSQPGQLPPLSQFQQGQERPGGSEGRFPRAGGFFLGEFHGLSWALLLLLILLHIGAALYHQFFRRDNLLGRMWFGKQTT